MAWDFETMRARPSSSPRPVHVRARGWPTAGQIVRGYRAVDGMWPSEWIPAKIDAAKAQYGDVLELEVGNL